MGRRQPSQEDVSLAWARLTAARAALFRTPTPATQREFEEAAGDFDAARMAYEYAEELQ